MVEHGLQLVSMSTLVVSLSLTERNFSNHQFILLWHTAIIPPVSISWFKLDGFAAYGGSDKYAFDNGRAPLTFSVRA